METSIFSFINHHIPPSKSWFLLQPFMLLLCLTLIFLKLKSVTRQASVVLLLVMFTLSIIVTLSRLLVMVLPSLLWQILIVLNTSMPPVEVEIQPIKQPVLSWLSVRTWMIISGFQWISRSCRLVKIGWIPTNGWALSTYLLMFFIFS